MFGGRADGRRPAPDEPPVDEGRPPAWLSELDDRDDSEELSFALYSDLGEVFEARTGVAAGRTGDE